MPDMFFRPVPVEYEPMKKTRCILTFQGGDKEYGSFMIRTSFSGDVLIDDIECEFIDSIDNDKGTSVFILSRKLYESINNMKTFNIKIDYVDPVGVSLSTHQMLAYILDVSIDNSFDSEDVSLKVNFRINKFIKTAKRQLILEKR